MSWNSALFLGHPSLSRLDPLGREQASQRGVEVSAAWLRPLVTPALP